MASSKIAAINIMAGCILVTVASLGLHHPRGGAGGPVDGSPAQYPNWHGTTNAQQYYRDENYNPDMV